MFGCTDVLAFALCLGSQHLDIRGVLFPVLLIMVGNTGASQSLSSLQLPKQFNDPSERTETGFDSRYILWDCQNRNCENHCGENHPVGIIAVELIVVGIIVVGIIVVGNIAVGRQV